ncbi:MAG: hypothetical protein SGI71_09685 [Verrucomicrobiota bacterium]|nr:hypothetical protein [Verrucomicrobiota bacterium]
MIFEVGTNLVPYWAMPKKKWTGLKKFVNKSKAIVKINVPQQSFKNLTQEGLTYMERLLGKLHMG